MLTRKNKLDKNKTVGVFQTNQKALCKNYCLMIYNGCSFLNYENEAFPLIIDTSTNRLKVLKIIAQIQNGIISFYNLSSMYVILQKQ